ncbi:MAG: Zn-dependent alcohol dehydrogenase [Micromonosporaceae bacterium]
MQMRAAVLTEFSGPLKVREIEIGDPGPGEVRVRIRASGVCGSDLKALDGTSPVVRDLPFVLGHECAGIVESTGPGVSRVKPGDHVIIAMNGPCGQCRNCGAGRFHLCGGTARMASIAGLMADGTTRLRVDGVPARPMIGIGAFAEYTVVGEAMCVKIRPGNALDVLCLLACGVVTGVGAVFNIARVEPGSSVLVTGCGGVGLNVIQGAALAAATTIIAADVVPAKLELARQFGATHTVLAGEGELAEQVGEIVRGGVDYAFDTTGAATSVGRTFAATRSGGTTVMVGSPPAGQTLAVDPSALFASRRLMGCQGGDAAPYRDIPRLADLYAHGRLRLDELVTERLPLDSVNDAMAHVRGGQVARSVIVFG